LGWEDQGYKMYFCFYNNPLFGVNTFAYSTPFTQQIIQAAREASGKNPARKSSTGVAKATQQVQGQTTTQQVQGIIKKSMGGRKRRRKRTKKKALKKKHRRTKRRKRKTRRKRGGKHKLSNKKCKMLRHQHSKLRHHVNMVGKALVQCKKRL